MADAESIVLAAITGSGGWVTDTNLFRGPVMPDTSYGAAIPRKAIFVTLTGGPPPLNLANGGSSPQRYQYDVQVIVRGDPDTYGTTRTAAAAVYARLHDQDPTGSIALRCQSPAPIYLGLDERRSPLFVVSTQLHYLE